MVDKLQGLKKRHEELSHLIADPNVLANQNEWKKLVKEHSVLTPIIDIYDKYVQNDKNLKDACALRDVEKDKEMHELLNQEIAECKEQQHELEEELKILMLPKDPNDDKNVVVEIRGGAGGDEAALFAAQLQRMYYRFAERSKWKVEEMSVSEIELGGIKEAVFIISGNGAYSKLKFESGVHRVQRVPATESQGRVHTSTCTVAVLPEAEDVEINIEEKDLKIDTYRSGGAGGQHVNKTESAIRITHLPTGLVVTCEDERSQIKNRSSAMKVLKARLYDHFQSQATKEYADVRKSQVGTGDRSERIRTYNFPQSRVTDHRIGMTLYSLDAFLDGDIYEMIEALRLADQNAKLQSQTER